MFLINCYAVLTQGPEGVNHRAVFLEVWQDGSNIVYLVNNKLIKGHLWMARKTKSVSCQTF